MCAELARWGVQLLNGLMDRPWGIRTARFRDLGGHIWETALGFKPSNAPVSQPPEDEQFGSRPTPVAANSKGRALSTG